MDLQRVVQIDVNGQVYPLQQESGTFLAAHTIREAKIGATAAGDGSIAKRVLAEAKGTFNATPGLSFYAVKTALQGAVDVTVTLDDGSSFAMNDAFVTEFGELKEGEYALTFAASTSDKL